MVSSVCISPPETEPVSLDEMKSFARLAGTSEDAFLESLIRAARAWAEGFTRRTFIAQSWRLILSDQPSGRSIILPRAPLIDVQLIQFYDNDDYALSWDVSNILIDKASMPGRIVLRDGVVWPSLLRTSSGMSVDYTAGYGGAVDVPEGMKLAIKQLALHWYENREAGGAEPQVLRVPMTVEALLQAYRIPSLGAACV